MRRRHALTCPLTMELLAAKSTDSETHSKLFRRMTMATNNQGGNNKGNNQSDNNSGSRGGNQGGNNQSGDTSNRGFASMDPERQREIAAEGGRAAHASGNAHEFTSEEAREAGKMSHGGGNQQSGSDSGSSRSGGQSGSSKQSGSDGGNSRSGGKSGSSSGSR